MVIGEALGGVMGGALGIRMKFVLWMGCVLLPGLSLGETAAVEFEKEIEPILEDYCYDCHGDGTKKGDLSMDEYGSLEDHLNDHAFWLATWRNLRSQVMPPSKKPQPDEEERRQVLRWIEKRVFELDPDNPDPGRVTIRRMNRMEYKNTVRDLLGVEFEVEDAFPPDDTGYGFDTVGDVLSISPLLMEKYMEAAKLIAAEALPADAAVIPEHRIDAGQLQQPGKRSETGRNMEFERDHTVEAVRKLEHDGTFRVSLEFAVGGSMEATGNTATVVLLVDGKELKREKVGWDYRKGIKLESVLKLKKGDRRFGVHLIPGDPPDKGEDRLAVQVKALTVKGPTEGGWWIYPGSYKRIFFDGPAPEADGERVVYAGKIFRRLVSRVYRRPADEATVKRLVEMAMAVDRMEGKLFQDGVRYGLVALLSSPRFLFRAEIQPEPNNPGNVVPLDEFALASRLSYFLWSSMPDEELYQLAEAGKLRSQLRAQVDRMLKDPKADRFGADFTGQWLQARDMEGVHVSARDILRTSRQSADRVFNFGTRIAMREETERLFMHVLRENRPSGELISANYTFLNERLAEFYGIKGVKGEEFRKVDLGDDGRRGGILTQGTFLIVTSNPTRTSPVKRGLFVLDNLLGTPAPPAPADVPELEETKKEGEGELTMREMMVRHRVDPLCKSCHARMDPIGLALENFNALGMWRDEEGGKPIDTAGQLLTGEKFSNVVELKKILATSRKQDFDRCLTEKLMTYAIGRGVEYYDAPVIDRIVAEAEESGGGLRDLICGIVESVPFQKRRGDGSNFKGK